MRPGVSVVEENATFPLRTPMNSSVDTSPAEMMASALAKSFSLRLRKELGLGAAATGEILTTATVTLKNPVAGWTISKIHLQVVARLPKVTQGRFIDASVRAKTNCLVARSLRANISMSARLES
jgi:osmotically inducible protein OsmC